MLSKSAVSEQRRGRAHQYAPIAKGGRLESALAKQLARLGEKAKLCVSRVRARDRLEMGGQALAFLRASILPKSRMTRMARIMRTCRGVCARGGPGMRFDEPDGPHSLCRFALVSDVISLCES